MVGEDGISAAAPAPGGEVAALLDSITAFSRRLSRRLTRRQPGFALVDWLLLRRLADGPPVQPAAIAKQLGVSRQRAQKQIAALAEQGLVVSQNDPDDERRKRVALTEAGRARLGELDAAIDAETAGLPSGAVGRAQAQLQRLLGGMAEKGGEKPGRRGKAQGKAAGMGPGKAREKLRGQGRGQGQGQAKRQDKRAGKAGTRKAGEAES